MGGEQSPFAGKCGMGPPIDPPGWKWKIGNRIRDMTFISPSNDVFRSKKRLAEFGSKKQLATGDKLDLKLFCWKVTNEKWQEYVIMQQSNCITMIGASSQVKIGVREKKHPPCAHCHKRIRSGLEEDFFKVIQCSRCRISLHHKCVYYIRIEKLETLQNFICRWCEANFPPVIDGPEDEALYDD